MTQDRPATIFDLNAAEGRILAKIQELDSSTKSMIRNIAAFSGGVTREIKSMIGSGTSKKGESKLAKPCQSSKPVELAIGDEEKSEEFVEDEVDGILLTSWEQLDKFCVDLRSKEFKMKKVIKLLLTFYYFFIN